MQASAPGKVILCGEHAVVYSQPAIALPLPDLRAMAVVTQTGSNEFVIELPDLGERVTARDHPDHPVIQLARSTAEQIGLQSLPHITLSLQSLIPIASGMGSGAALGAALVKVIAAYSGSELPPQTVSRLVYESERFFHGTPSGIDNTVVSYEQAIWFERTTHNGRLSTNDQPAPATIEPITIGRSFWLVIGDTGVWAPTHLTVGGVRQRWQRDPDHYNALFAAIGDVVRSARSALAAGDLAELGALLDQNQTLLEQIGVSSPQLERLIAAARRSGALGAKLSGGGGGGIMLALTDEATHDRVAAGVRSAGAARVISTPLHGDRGVVHG